MVREGRPAEVITCREAEVKSPVPGCPRMPVEAAVADGMATSRRVREAGEIPLASVREGGQAGRVSEASVQNSSVVQIVCASESGMIGYVREQSPAVIAGRKPVQIAPRIVEKSVSSREGTQPMRADSSLTLAQLFSDIGISGADGKQASDKEEI